MRIYKNCKEAASETKRELKEMGTIVKLETMQDKVVKDDPAYYTNELLGYSYMINDLNDVDAIVEAFSKGSEMPWGKKELIERIGGQKLNPGEAYKERAVWEEFVHDGKFSYTYSERIGDQIGRVIRCLSETPSSRNAIITIWDREIDKERIGGKMRVPCSMYYQFLIRNGRLNQIYNIRSNDLMTHWCWDVWMAIKIQEIIAQKLDLPMGFFMQQIGSLHAYHKDIKGIF
jgi:thymidylate synthase